MTRVWTWRAAVGAWWRVALVGLAAGLAACGGGGGGGGADAAPAATDDPSAASLTLDNYVALGSSYAPRIDQAFVYSRAEVRKLWPAGGQTIACPSGGSYSVTLTHASPSVDTVGDSVRVVYDNCRFADGSSHGTVTDVMTAVERSSSETDAAHALSFTRTYGVSGTSPEGSFDTTAAYAGRSVRTAANVGEDTMTYSGTSTLTPTGGAKRTASFHEIASRTVYASGAATTTISGTIDDSLAGGRFTVSTTSPIVANLDSVASTFENPHAGTIVLASAKGSRVRVTARPDGNAVLIELDAEGDGAFEANTPTTWAAIGRSTNTGTTSSTAGLTADNHVSTSLSYAPKSQRGAVSWFRSPSGTTTYPCSGGGSAVATVMTADIDHDSVGDSVLTVYTDCKQSIVTKNGTYRKVLTAVGLSTSVASHARDLSITETRSERWTVDGSSSIEVFEDIISVRTVRQDRDVGEDSSDISLSSTTTPASGVAATSKEVYSERVTYGGGTASVSRNGTIDTSWSGPLTLSTGEPFRINLNDNKPTAGTAVLKDATGAQVRVTARSDGSTVFVEFDNAGDGAFETGTTTTWDAIS